MFELLVLLNMTIRAKSEKVSADCLLPGDRNLASMSATVVLVSWCVKDIKSKKGA